MNRATLRFVAHVLVVLLAAIGGLQREAVASELSAAQEEWVSTTLEAMTLEEKAAQMMMVAETGYPRNARSQAALELVAAVRDQGVGGLILMRSEAGSITGMVNGLDSAAGGDGHGAQSVLPSLQRIRRSSVCDGGGRDAL